MLGFALLAFCFAFALICFAFALRRNKQGETKIAKTKRKQIDKSIIHLLSCTFEEKIKLDEYAMFLILIKINPDESLDYLEKNGQFAATQIINRF
jgi:hypothetical protein